MTQLEQLVVFRVEEQRFALRLEVVDRVIHAVEITPLPGAPPNVLGAIDVQGRVIPVLNTRRRFQLPERDITPHDQLLLARAGDRPVALVIDEVEGVAGQASEEMTRAGDVTRGLELFHGVAGLSDGLVLIHDLEKFLSSSEESALDAATHQSR